MSLGSIVYHNVTKRFSTVLLASVAGAYIFNYSLDGLTNFYWDSNNRNKQWKDVKKTIAQE